MAADIINEVPFFVRVNVDFVHCQKCSDVLLHDFTFPEKKAIVAVWNFRHSSGACAFACFAT